MNKSRLSVTVPVMMSSLLAPASADRRDVRRFGVRFLAMRTLDAEVTEVFPSASSLPPDYAMSSLWMVGMWTKRAG